MPHREHSVVDSRGNEVQVGSRVRVLGFSGDWYERLPSDERVRVDSMLGDVLVVDEIDQYGQPWVTKWWPNDADGTCVSHSVALASDEMLRVDLPEP